MNIKENTQGEIGVNNFGTKMYIIKHVTRRNITVKFLDDYGAEVNTRYEHFKNGSVKNPYDRTVWGVGCLGVGEYTRFHPSFKYWESMLKRCYGASDLKKLQAYKNKKVCDEWLIFQNFAVWFDENYYEVNGERMELDKDYLNMYSDLYSPQNCIFVPQRINKLIETFKALRGNTPIGVRKNYVGSYTASCSIIKNGKVCQQHLGSFKDEKSAFESYKTFKETYIKQVADEYKPEIPQKLYEAMYNWEVYITV